MAVKVHISIALRRLTSNQAVVEASGEDIISIIEDLNAHYPGIKEKLCNEEGNPKGFVNFYINGEDIRYLDGKMSKVKDGDEVSIIQAIAGG